MSDIKDKNNTDEMDEITEMKELGYFLKRGKHLSGGSMEDIPIGKDYAQWKVDDMNNRLMGDLNERDGYNCQKCNNRGYIFKLDKNGYECQAECECMAVRRNLRAMQKSGLGDVLAGCTFEKYETTEEWQKLIKQKAETFCVDDAAKWFYIGGQVGIGKSHLCSAIARHYVHSGKSVKYMVWTEESKKLKASVNDYLYQELIDEYKNVEVLYIDDFLKVKQGEKPTPADISLAFEIINHRMLNKDAITIISSEKTINELLEYDEATMSRIYQKTGKYRISIGKDQSKNYRLKGMDEL